MRRKCVIAILLVAFLLLPGCAADTTPPTMAGVRDLSCLVGEGLALYRGVTVSDDRAGKVTLNVDTSALDTTRAGFYEVIYIATDAAGNETRQRCYVTVYDKPLEKEALWAACDGVLADILPADASAEQKCRAIYAYVQKTLEYFPVSDKSDWMRAAERAIETERGDCFSYFALTKALLTRAGVTHLDVERIHAPGEETHFWLMVDLGETGSSRWYHLDPTELDASYGDHNGCLFTDAELLAYHAVREGFYAYDRAAYPASATATLSPNDEQGGQ